MIKEHQLYVLQLQVAAFEQKKRQTHALRAVERIVLGSAYANRFLSRDTWPPKRKMGKTAVPPPGMQSENTK